MRWMVKMVAKTAKTEKTHLSHNLAILASARLRLIRIHNEERGTAIRVLGHEGPLQPRGEPSSTTATQARILHFLDDPVGAHRHYFLCHVIVTTLPSIGESPILLSIQVCKDAILIRQALEFRAASWFWGLVGCGELSISSSGVCVRT